MIVFPLKPRQLFFALMYIALLVYLAFGPSEAHAKTFLGEGVFQKNAQKESTRWTLADWMTQKKQFNAMDQWLALNKSLDIFELNIEGGQRTYDVSISGNSEEETVDRAAVSLYWSIFGLEYTLENSSEDFKRESYQFNLRLLGASSQTTNLTGFYGLTKMEWADDSTKNTENNFYGGKLNIYIVSFFGLAGMYRKDDRAKADNDDYYERERMEYGAFFDVYFVRIYGQAFKETTTRTPSSGGANVDEEREGTEAGIKFYF